MTGPDPEPAGDALLGARLYALLHQGTPGDVAFYERACQNARSVLELGCGAGRILTALAPRVPHLTGLDLNPDALALARRAAGPDVTLVRGDMRRFSLPERFDRVLIPYNALFALDSDEGVTACLRAAAAHATADAELFVDVYVLDLGDPDDMDDEEPWDEEFGHLVTLYDDGLLVDVYDRELALSTHDLVVSYRFHTREGAEERVVRQSIRHHTVPPERLSELLEQAGWRVRQRWADFDDTPFHASAGRVVIRATR